MKTYKNNYFGIRKVRDREGWWLVVGGINKGICGNKLELRHPGNVT